MDLENLIENIMACKIIQKPLSDFELQIEADENPHSKNEVNKIIFDFKKYMGKM